MNVNLVVTNWTQNGPNYFPKYNTHRAVDNPVGVPSSSSIFGLFIPRSNAQAELRGLMVSDRQPPALARC
jgi:hypothetical protein